MQVLGAMGDDQFVMERKVDGERYVLHKKGACPIQGHTHSLPLCQASCFTDLPPSSKPAV